MAEGDDKESPPRGVISAEDRASILARASDLNRRLDEAKARHSPPPSPEKQVRSRSLGHGLRIAIDLVVGVAFGGFVGWWLDRYFGSAPWIMVLLIILGFAAGMTNVIRTARRMQAEAEASQLAAPSVKDGAREDD